MVVKWIATNAASERSASSLRIAIKTSCNSVTGKVEQSDGAAYPQRQDRWSWRISWFKQVYTRCLNIAQVRRVVLVFHNSHSLILAWSDPLPTASFPARA